MLQLRLVRQQSTRGWGMPCRVRSMQGVYNRYSSTLNGATVQDMAPLRGMVCCLLPLSAAVYITGNAEKT